jgi:hypothetical protein
MRLLISYIKAFNINKYNNKGIINYIKKGILLKNLRLL